MSNIQEYADTIVSNYSSKLYGVYMNHIAKAMDGYKETGKMSGDIAGFLVISGDSLLAARYREWSDAQFSRDGVVFVGIEKKKTQEAFDHLTKRGIEELNLSLGIPVLVFFRGDYELRYLDFQIDDNDANNIIDCISLETIDSTEVRKIFALVREYHNMKEDDNDHEQKESS